MFRVRRTSTSSAGWPPPSRRTDSNHTGIGHTGAVIRRLGCAVVLIGLATVACSRTDGGSAVRAGDTPTPLSTTSSSDTSTPTSTSRAMPSTEIPDSSQPGVAETTKHPVAPNSVVCAAPSSGQTADAVTADPAAPRITIALPPGWTSQPGSGDVGARLSGPNGMVGDVRIAPASSDPAASFTHYADDVMAKYPISSLSALPAELCGYSGQKLMGNWADNPDRSIQYNDRIVHIWTNGQDYLVSVHVEALSGTPGFNDAASVLTGDFGVSVP